MIRMLTDLIPFHLTCDDCGTTIHRHAVSALELRWETEPEGWQWVVIADRMTHRCPGCAT